MAQRVNLQSRRQRLKHFAPRYRAASSAHKGVLLDPFVQATGSHRRYGIWLLTHAEDVLHAPTYKRASQSGPEVQQALFLLWKAATRSCAKRLLPFLPTLLEALERHEQLHLWQECRSQLLSMSAATADRLLRSQRTRSAWPFHHTSRHATQAADSHSHVPEVEGDPARLRGGGPAGPFGTTIQGGSLYTLTLTDGATGWTACLSLAVPEKGAGAGCLPTRADTVPLSDPLD